MADLRIDSDLLFRQAGEVQGVAVALRSCDTTVEAWANSVGHRELESVVQEFADGSALRRRRLAEDLDQLGDDFRHTAWEFTRVDADLAGEAG